MLLYQWLIEICSRSGNAKAIIYRDTYLSWRGLLERVDRRAIELAAIGIRQGHWAGLMLGNVPEFIIFSLALSKLGATVVPIDPSMGVRELQHLLEVIPLRALITRPRGGTDPSSTLPPSGSRTSLKASIESKATPTIEPETRKRLQGTLITCALYKRDPQPIDSVPVVFISSDEWGRPKGVLKTEQNLTAQCQSLRDTLSLTADHHILAVVPLHMAYGFEDGFLSALHFGITLYLEEETAPARILKLLREQDISVFLGLPRIYASLTKMVTISPKLIVKDPRFLCSESYLDPTMAEAFYQRYGPPILSLYRTTEAGAISLDQKGKALGTVGTSVSGVEIMIENSQEPADELSGSPILIRSKACAQREIVLSTSASSTEHSSHFIEVTDENGWFRTGDKGSFTEAGNLVLKGREDDMVKIGEKRVMMHELIRCVQTYPKVQRAEVKARLDTDQTFSLVAEAFCKEACTEEELLDHCARFLAPYKVPRRVEIIIDGHP